MLAYYPTWYDQISNEDRSAAVYAAAKKMSPSDTRHIESEMSRILERKIPNLGYAGALELVAALGMWLEENKVANP